MRDKNSKKGFLNCIYYFYSIAAKVKPVYFFLIFFNAVSIVISPFISIWGIQFLIDEIADESRRSPLRMLICVGCIVIGNAIVNIVKKFTLEKENTYNRIFERTLAEKLNQKNMNLPFVDRENPEILDKIQKASRALEETGVVQGITDNVVAIFSYLLVMLMAVIFILKASVFLVVPVFISTLAGIVVNLKTVALRESNYRQMGRLWRKSDYFSSEILEKQYAKEVRLYSCDELLLEHQKIADADVICKEKELAKGCWRFERVRIFFVEICNIFELLIIGWKAYFKEISLGELASLIAYALQFSNAMQQIVKGYMELCYVVDRLNCYVEVMGLSEENEDVLKPQVHAAGKAFELTFDNVSFRYPGQENYCLRNVSFTIGDGEHLSIVGENGAGKTTLVKLICRLYKPDEGHILLNGADIWSYSRKDYIDRLSVVFQDFKLLAFSIRDNISIGTDISDKELEAYCESYGLNEWIQKLDKKYDTCIYKMFDSSGVEPSGGQAQKLSIVRALYKNATMVILDEPTAALDPISEAEIFEHFDSLIRGKTALYISHRLSSCRFCDRIIVLQNGSICEAGTHDELMAKENGYYAGLYMTQAGYYK